MWKRKRAFAINGSSAVSILGLPLHYHLNRLFSHTVTEAWSTGESVNCDHPRTQMTSRSICSFAVIGRERLCVCHSVCPARPSARVDNKRADYPSVLSLHHTLIWPSNVANFSGTGEFLELRRPPAEISGLSFFCCACETGYYEVALVHRKSQWNFCGFNKYLINLSSF